jgi:hypothetical protein
MKAALAITAVRRRDGRPAALMLGLPNATHCRAGC